MTGRVGVIGPNDEDDFAANIADGLRDLGRETITLGRASAPTLPGPAGTAVQMLGAHRRIAPHLERKVVRRAVDAGVDVAITVTSLHPATVHALQQNGIRTALWFPDAVSNLGPLWMFSAPYDGVFFKEPALVDRLRSLLTLPVHYLPEACNPGIHRLPETLDAAVAGKVVVVGNLHPIRARLLERLSADGVPLAIYGNPRDKERNPSLARFHTGSYVRGVAKSAVFRSAAAVLNNLHPAEIDGMNCRLFEATASGGAVISEWRRELPKLFDIGSEVLAFENYDELLERLRFAIEHPEEMRTLGDAASRRAHGEHTYAHRLTDLLEKTLGT